MPKLKKAINLSVFRQVEALERVIYIEIDIDSMAQHQLDQWKRDAQPWPAFLSKETQEAAVSVLNRVEEALSRQRLNYIVSLIDQLNAEEK